MSFNCDKVRELDWTEDEAVLSNAEAHAEGCSECRQYLESNGRLSSFLDGLPEVEVPGDFNQTVRSKIAAGRESADWGPWLGIAVPAAAVCLIAAFVLFNPGLYSSSAPDLASGKDNTESLPGSVEKVVANAEKKEVSESPVKREAEDNPVETEKTDEVEKPVVEEASQDNDGKTVAVTEKDGEKIFSRDFTAQEPEVVLPPGLEGNQVPGKPRESRTFSVVEVLQPLGIQSAPARNGMRVVSVSKNSLAEKAGIRAGDIVVALDGKPIRSAVTKGAVRGRSVTVLRDGKRIKFSVMN